MRARQESIAATLKGLRLAEALRRGPCPVPPPPAPPVAPRARIPFLPLAGLPLLAWAPVRADEGSLYEVLGVDKNASEQDIKKAYKRAAVKFHPDKAPEAERAQYEERFKRISRAYEILSDPQKRRAYDARGEAAFDGRDAAGAAGFQGADPFEMFRSMFGQNFGFGFGREVTPDVGYEMEVSLEDFYAGFSKTVHYERDAVCSSCSGLGARNVQTCSQCRGMGMVVEERQFGSMVQRIQRTCPVCGGRGAVASDRCGSCRGSGFQRDRVELRVVAPPGCPDRERFLFPGKADESPGMEAGSIIIELKEKRHPLFARLGNEDLLVTQRVPLLDALCGVHVRVKHLNGKNLDISGPQGKMVRPGEVWVLPGLGMPKRGNPRNHGDLLIRFEVDFPEDLPAGASRESLRHCLFLEWRVEKCQRQHARYQSYAQAVSRFHVMLLLAATQYISGHVNWLGDDHDDACQRPQQDFRASDAKHDRVKETIEEDFHHASDDAGFEIDEKEAKSQESKLAAQISVQRGFGVGQCSAGDGQKTTSCGSDCEVTRAETEPIQGEAQWGELMDAMEDSQIPSTLVSMVLGVAVTDSYFFADEREDGRKIRYHRP
ncbi:DNAJA2 [Symbiodinium natans]|uniref:DNAJA2 protein n=1 Tax=Symbiodinium natans TaxID=878477 RepID=A0A812M9D1_9DINO|nr:DNAJA2 [Symbiodinium natans]